MQIIKPATLSASSNSNGDELVILLGGGSKKQQSKDIKKAQELWREYKRLKKRGV